MSNQLFGTQHEVSEWSYRSAQTYQDPFNEVELDGLIEGRTFICGEEMTMADIALFVFLDFGRQVEQPFDLELSTIPDWFERMAARPSASA